MEIVSPQADAVMTTLDDLLLHVTHSTALVDTLTYAQTERVIRDIEGFLVRLKALNATRWARGAQRQREGQP